MKYFLTASGAGISLNNEIPAGAVEAQIEHYENQGNYTISNGAIVPVSAEIQAERAWAAYRAAAASALASTDSEVSKINEAVLMSEIAATDPAVQAFLLWRKALRQIVSAPSGTIEPLPAMPALPL